MQERALKQEVRSLLKSVEYFKSNVSKCSSFKRKDSNVHERRFCSRHDSWKKVYLKQARHEQEPF